jgi:hypothetical protein
LYVVDGVRSEDPLVVQELNVEVMDLTFEAYTKSSGARAYEFQ